MLKVRTEQIPPIHYVACMTASITNPVIYVRLEQLQIYLPTNINIHIMF